MKKPRFDKRVRDGLRTMAGHADAGGPEDIGLEADSETYENVMRACEWIWSLKSDEETEK